MQVILIILIILFSIILYLLLEILFYRPHIDKKENDNDDFTEEIPVINTDDYHSSAEDYLSAVKTIWPDLNAVIHKTVLSHAVIFFYEGKEDPDVFIMEREDNMHAFFAAADELWQENRYMHSFILAIPLSRKYRMQAIGEIDDWLRHIHPSFILQEGSDNKDLTGKGDMYALIGTTIAGEVRYTASGMNEKEWKEHLSGIQFPSIFNENNQKIMVCFMDQMPWQMRMEMKFSFLQKKAVDNFIAWMPRLSLAFKPQCILEGEEIVLRAPEEKMLQEAEELLKKNAAQYGVTLTAVSRRKPVYSHNQKAYEAIREAVNDAFIVKEVIPSILSYKDQLCSSKENQVWYSPLNEGRKDAARAAVLFYKNLLHMS